MQQKSGNNNTIDMKKLVLVLAFLPLFTWAQDRIMVIADPHVYPLSAIDQEADFDTYMAKQRKMIDLSEPVWNALIDTALAYHPSLVLIPGDLTRDGELVAHDTVAAALNRLQQAGIRTLVIPGNHDLPDNVAWESLYMDSTMVKDPDSYSYAVKALQGLTVLGIDGSNGKASVGTLSEQSLAWLLAQADSAVAKGHTIIAMCHWQILEHFDQQGTLESSCRMKNADALRDSLMAHGVHLVLTGHFHVNGITTYRDTTGLTNDSLMEITTGSPITYPCPYRWLTLSADRADITVETDYLTAVDTIADMETYSREWMREHTQNLIPTLALKVWNKVDNNWDRVEAALSKVYMGWLSESLRAALPQTDSARIDLVQRYLGTPAIDLYLFHSEANENERPEMGQAMAQAVYAGMDGMMDEVFGAYEELVPIFKAMARSMAEEPVQSMVKDVTQWKSATYADQTNDLRGTWTVNAPQNFEALEIVPTNTSVRKILLNGQVLILRGQYLYTPQGQPVNL